MRALVSLMVLVLASFAAAQDKAKPADLPAGLSPEQARARLGPPTRVSRQIFAHRCVEQWHYGAPLNLRLVFDCPRGEVPKLVRTRRSDE